MTQLLSITNHGLVRLAEGDGEWRASSLRAAGSLQCLALDPREPGTLYLGSRGDGVWKSADGGENWTDLELPVEDVFSLAVSPVDGAVYAGCEPSRLFRSDDGGGSWRELAALRELPSAPGWSFPPRPWTSHVSAIAPHPRDAGVLIVGIEAGGLMRSEDGGETWQDHRPGAQPDVHALAWHPRSEGRAYQTGGGGAAWSDDGGRVWQAADAGRDRHYCWALAVCESEPDLWYLSASPDARHAHGPADADAALYRWRGEGPWERLEGGLPRPLRTMPYALSSHGGRLFAGLASGEIHLSRDRGDSWQPLRISGESLEGLRLLLPWAGR